MLTLERKNALTEFLLSDEDRAKTLVGLEPNEAVTHINEGGLDITVDELVAYGDAIKQVQEEEVFDVLGVAAGGVGEDMEENGLNIFSCNNSSCDSNWKLPFPKKW